MDRGSVEKYLITKVPRKKFDCGSGGVILRNSANEREEQF